MTHHLHYFSRLISLPVHHHPHTPALFYSTTHIGGFSKFFSLLHSISLLSCLPCISSSKASLLPSYSLYLFPLLQMPHCLFFFQIISNNSSLSFVYISAVPFSSLFFFFSVRPKQVSKTSHSLLLLLQNIYSHPNVPTEFHHSKNKHMLVDETVFFFFFSFFRCEPKNSK